MLNLPEVVLKFLCGGVVVMALLWLPMTEDLLGGLDFRGSVSAIALLNVGSLMISS